MSKKKLLKKILFNNKKFPRNFNVYKVEYSLGQSVSIPTIKYKKEYNISKIESRNSILKLINDFYYELFSIKNLPRIWWGLLLILVPAFWMIFSSINSLMLIKSPSFIQEITPVFYAAITAAILFFMRDRNEKAIIKKVGNRSQLALNNINEARYFWLLERCGAETDFFELAKNLSEWKALRESYSGFFQYDYRRSIYNANAKPRIIALSIAFISVCALLIMNVSEVSFDEVIDQLIVNFFYITIASPVIILYYLILAFVILFSWRMILFVLDSLVSKSIVSNIRFGFLIEFLTSYSLLIKSNSKYRKF